MLAREKEVIVRFRSLHPVTTQIWYLYYINLSFLDYLKVATQKVYI